MSRLAAPAELPVTFRFRPGAARFVDLRGDLVHWSHLERLIPQEDGWLEATLPLGPGTYSYKLHVDGSAWQLDPENPRTRARDGSRNSLLVVDGAPEPVLHAPARPWIFSDDGGRVVLRAGLRRGHGEALTVRWDEGDGRREAALAVVAEEDEHLLFEAALPASARALTYVFALPDGRVVGRAGGGGQAFRVALSALPPRTPAWWRDAVVYTVFVDRFRRGGHAGAWGAPPAGDQARCGGDLDGVTEALGHLADLGVTALHLTPVVTASSAHRYDAVDLRRVDPALGGEAALERLLAEAHRRGLRVLLDLPVTHVHRDFFAFRDVRARGPRSPYATWFHLKYWPFPDGPDGGYLHYEKGQWQEPLLRTDEPEVVAYLAETFAHWARFGADGFRVDAAADVPLGLLRRVAEAARAARPDAVVYGEVIPGNLHRFTADALDAATDFPAQEAILDWIARGRADAPRTAARLALRRLDRGGPGWSALAFTSTHDQARLLSQTGDPRRARLGHLLGLLGAAVPAIYYGDEIGLRGAGGGARDFDDAWPDRRPMPWDPATWDAATLDLFRDALRLRREEPALARGDEAFFALADDVILLRRTHADEVVDVILHAGEGERVLPLPAGAPSGATVRLTLGEAAVEADATLRLAPGAAAVEADAATLRLGPWSAAVLSRVPAAATLAAFRDLSAHSRLVAGLAFRDGLLASPALPPNLSLTVTERCNIRCGHCITDAPARTAEGRARTVHPWVLDALHEPFAAADYVAFVHGGEALTAAIFPEVLRRIQRARAGRPTHVHLLSNGMLLDGARARELIALGVTSISVSLDGATASTNDRLRLGGQLATIVANLREVVAARRETGADLRLGVSAVATATNLAELPALGRLVAGLGLDWLKVEELFPCTPLARHELVFPREPAVEAAMAALREALGGTGVVLVDHRDPPRGCGCLARGDAALAAFRAADDFANRAPFHPCRAEWEQACVDPDGTVRAMDYGQPALGNLGERSFLELWNGPAAQQARRAALARTSPGMRRGCPIGG
jgi:glycosidase/MoaA/NifB/PqqE/SkfB family radical SAM enzyme